MATCNFSEEKKKEIEKIYVYCEKTVKSTWPEKNDVVEAVKTKLQSNQFAKKLKSFQLFNDPIHGSIELNALEQAIVHTPEFSRLKDIKQLGGTSFVYPGATHTRFEHSIGVCYIAGQLVDHLKNDIKMAEKEREEAQKKIDEAKKEIEEAKKDDEDKKKIEEAETRKEKAEKLLESCLNFKDEDDKFTEEDGYCIRIAALCHDLGHGPFSHLFESVAETIIKEKFKHEKMSKLIFKKILLDNPTVLANFIEFGLTQRHVEIIEDMIGVKDIKEDAELEENERGVNRPNRKFHYEVVANKFLGGMDVDKWDYFARDCHYLGIGNNFDWHRTMTLSKIVDVKDCEKDHHNGYHIGFRDKQADNILRMYWTRSTLHQKAYQHPAGNGVELLIKDVFLKMKDVKFIGIPSEEEERSQTANESTLYAIHPVKTISIKDALQMAQKKHAELSGYITLSDTLLDRIYYLADKGYSLTEELRHKEEAPIKEARYLITRLKKRDIYDHVSELEVSIPFGDEYNMKGVKETIKELLQKEKFYEFSEIEEESKKTFEIETVPIKFASEDNPDPLRDIFFHEKYAKRNEVLSMFDEISDINKPKAYVEYRLRFYSKISNEKQEPEEMKSIQKQFKIWSTRMKDQLLKEKVWFGYKSFPFKKEFQLIDIHGLRFEIRLPDGHTLPAKAKVIIRTAITCEHTAPSGYNELVSGVYSISTTPSFTVEVKFLEIEHCCLNGDLCLGVSTNKSPMDKFPLYKFELLKEGTQEDKEKTKVHYTNYTLDNPSVFGVFRKNKCRYRYCAHLCSSVIVEAHWNVYLLITKDTEIMKECVNKFSKEKKAVVLPHSYPIEFLDEQIELSQNGQEWNIQPSTMPIIKKQEVDLYVGHGLIPHCHFYLTYSDDDNIKLKLNGANPCRIFSLGDFKKLKDNH